MIWTIREASGKKQELRIKIVKKQQQCSLSVKLREREGYNRYE